MSKKVVKNVAASVSQKLLNISRAGYGDYQYILIQYLRERFLYRLQMSEYKEMLILKGGFLLSIWSQLPCRPTKDLDFLGFGNDDISRLEGIFKDICNTMVKDDGVVFLSDTISGSRIKKEQHYQGIRIYLKAQLNTAIIPMQFDIGFGDIVKPIIGKIPSLLGFSEPEIKMYSMELLIAEKFEIMVKLDEINSRMKDFFDIWYLAENFPFNGAVLSEAISNTFNRRQTLLPTELPIAFTNIFQNIKQKQWNAYLKKERIDLQDKDFKSIIEVIKKFIMPPVIAINKGESFNKVWTSTYFWQ